MPAMFFFWLKLCHGYVYMHFYIYGKAQYFIAMFQILIHDICDVVLKLSFYDKNIFGNADVSAKLKM